MEVKCTEQSSEQIEPTL